MCGIYSCRSACLYYKIYLSVCPDVCLCIDFHFTSTLGGGDIKGVSHNISTKSCTSPGFTCYSRVLLYYSSAEVLTRNKSLLYTECVRNDEPTVTNSLILATDAKYYVPVNKSIYCAGFSSENSDYLCEINVSPEPIPYSLPKMASTSSLVPG